MKTMIALLPMLFFAPAFAGDSGATPGTSVNATHSAATSHRYLIERTFPAGALEGLDSAGKAKINATNAKFGVQWVMSYANAAKTKTYCIYKAPSEAAVREAAQANAIPVDSITEVPVTLTPR
jgi:hypothetical protein